MTLPHHTPNCGRYWMLLADNLTAVWLCESSGQRLEDEPETRAAVIPEIHMGLLLHRLAERGRKLIDGSAS